MADRLTPRPWQDPRGFTPFEVLAVLLIVGFLAALALPAFVGQRTRAQDTEAKAAVSNAGTTLEAFHKHRRTYDATRAELIDIELSLADARDFAVTGTVDTFTISVASKAGGGGGTFSIERAPDGTVTRLCSRPGHGGCRAKPDAGGNRW